MFSSASKKRSVLVTFNLLTLFDSLSRVDPCNANAWSAPPTPAGVLPPVPNLDQFLYDIAWLNTVLPLYVNGYNAPSTNSHLAIARAILDPPGLNHELIRRHKNALNAHRRQHPWHNGKAAPNSAPAAPTVDASLLVGATDGFTYKHWESFSDKKYFQYVTNMLEHPKYWLERG